MEDRRNIIMAVLLTGAILFGWPYISSYFFPAPPKPVASSVANNSGNSETGATVDAPVNATTASAKDLPLGTALASGPRVAIETPKLKGSINLQGAKIDDLVLPTHREALPKDSPPVRLLAPSGTKDAYFLRFSWVGQGVTLPDDKSIWTASATKLTPAAPVTLEWTNAEGSKFAIVFSVDANYLISAKQSFTNAGATAVEIAPVGLLSRKGKPEHATKGGSIFTQIHIGPMGVFNNKPNYDWGYDQVAENPDGVAKFASKGGWMGFTEKYWLAAIIPDQSVTVNAKFSAHEGMYQADMVPDKYTAVAPGATSTANFRAFGGAKEDHILNDYTKRLGIPYLNYAIDWGWFWFIAIPFQALLLWLYGIFGHFAFAILALTLIVRAFMFPVAQKQFASMAAMRVVQPKMKAVQERWKDDKQRQQQEIMKLYQTEKVNPVAGCLPILLQIPVFFALYKTLMLTVEMRHQSFLWIKDLSAPDPFLFGLFPDLHLPQFLAIGILPILLGLTMWAMQKLNPPAADPAQQQVMAIMPWMMMFVFATLASGLQLYYVFSNILSIAQQKWLYSKHPILRQQAEKDAAEKARA